MSYRELGETEVIEGGALGELRERGEAVRDATNLIAQIRPMLPFAGSTRQDQGAKERYAAGRKFVVMKEGARLEGIRSFGKFRAGYAEVLEVGDVIESTGWREGLCGGGVMEANFKSETSPDNVMWLQFWPFNGLFLPWPLDGWLEPFEDADIESIKAEAAEAARKEKIAAKTCDCPEGMSCDDCDTIVGAPGFAYTI